jgi:hypothetical protein
MINKFQLIQSKPSHNNKKQENKETSLMKENLRKQNGIITRANETETKWGIGRATVLHLSTCASTYTKQK